MELSVICSCGREILVSPSSCGSAVRCFCGREVPVPRLSLLRRNAGLSAYNLSAADRLRTLYAQGELPLENDCVSCKRKTSHQVRCVVECEKQVVQGRGVLDAIALFFLTFTFPIRALMLSGEGRHEPEVHGREINVETPVRICQACLQSIPASKRVLRLIDLVSATPLYQKLFEEHPDAEVYVYLPKHIDDPAKFGEFEE